MQHLFILYKWNAHMCHARIFLLLVFNRMEESTCIVGLCCRIVELGAVLESFRTSFASHIGDMFEDGFSILCLCGNCFFLCMCVHACV